MGHLLAHLQDRSHLSLIFLLCPACFARALRGANQFACSFNYLRARGTENDQMNRTTGCSEPQWAGSLNPGRYWRPFSRFDSFFPPNSKLVVTLRLWQFSFFSFFFLNGSCMCSRSKWQFQPLKSKWLFHARTRILSIFHARRCRSVFRLLYRCQGGCLHFHRFCDSMFFVYILFCGCCHC